MKYRTWSSSLEDYEVYEAPLEYDTDEILQIMKAWVLHGDDQTRLQHTITGFKLRLIHYDSNIGLFMEVYGMSPFEKINHMELILNELEKYVTRAGKINRFNYDEFVLIKNP